MTPVALACTWLLHVFSTTASLQNSPEQNKLHQGGDGDALALLGWARWWLLLPAVLIPKRTFAAFVHGGGCCSEGFLTWAGQAVFAGLMGAVFRREKTPTFISNTKSFRACSSILCWGFCELRGVWVPIEVWKDGVLFIKYVVWFLLFVLCLGCGFLFICFPKGNVNKMQYLEINIWDLNFLKEMNSSLLLACYHFCWTRKTN